ncbi:MAG: DMT family transporter [Acidimicrobiales bacterium]|nr:DMT family transporter [Acidimicrobiales bacterium]
MTVDTVERSRSTNLPGVIAILAATACWSSGGVLAKNADHPGVVLAFWRLLIVTTVFGVILVATGRSITWPMLKRSIPGGLLFGCNLAVWFEALRHATVGIATVTGALTPVLAMLIGWRLLGERISGLAMACAAGAVGGVIIFVVPGFAASGTTALGMGLAFAAILLWVCYLLVTKRAREGVGTIEYLFLMASVATVSLLPVLLASEEGRSVPDHGWGWIIALALIPGSIGHGLLAWAQAHVPLSTAGILLQGEPVGAAIAGAIFLGETIGALQALGLLLAFIALAVLTRATSGPAEQAPPVDA